MTTPDTFIARMPNGRLIRLRAKQDIDKLADLDPCERMAATLKMFPSPKRCGRSFNEIMAEEMAKAAACDDEVDEALEDDRDERERDAERDDGDTDTEKGGGSAGDHPIVHLARLLVASGKFSDHGQALHHLLNTPHGAALLHRTRTHKAEKESQPMTSLQDIVKSFGVDGVVEIAKNIVEEQKSSRITEHELVELATTAAQSAYPTLSPSQAFAKLYASERVLREAVQVAKAMPFVADLSPLVVGGEANRGGDVNPNDPAEAIAQLKELGARKWPTASEAQQFANAFTHPGHEKLAARAHRRPTPTTHYPMPR
jgi:hypothetical protein